MLRFMNECQNRFFPEFMRSPLAKYQFDAPQRGIKNSFRLGDVGEMLVPVPPKEEQFRIVRQIEQMMDICCLLKEKINKGQAIKNYLSDSISSSLVN